MPFNVALSCSLLLALVVPFGLGASATHSGAGVVLYPAKNVFNAVTGNVKVPNLSGQSGDAIAVSVTLDVIGCADGARFFVGFMASIAANGTTSYFAWYKDPTTSGHKMVNIGINAQDEVVLAITTNPSMTSGTASIINLSTGNYRNISLSAPKPLCGASAGWILELESNTTLPNFGDVQFTSAKANGTLGLYGPSSPDAETLAIEQNGVVETNLTRSGSSLSIEYIG